MIHALRSSSFYFISFLFALLTPLSFVEAAGSLTIQSLSPGTTVSINSPVTFSVVQTGLTSPTYTVDDAGTSLTPNINASGNFSWTPTNRDVGVHNITISATDNAGNSATVAQSITVILPSISITGMVNGPAAYVGKQMTFQVTPVGFTSPTFWLGDSVGGSTLSNSRLNSSGAFSWWPQYSDIGPHKMMINVSDRSSHYAELTQDITVSPAPKPEIVSLIPGTTTPVGATVSFSVTAPGFTSPTITVRDTYSPTTITSDSMTAGGSFSWVPLRSQTGVHNINVVISDSTGAISVLNQIITVQDPALAIDGLTPGDTVTVGTLVKFNVNLVGLATPTYTASDNYPGGSSITTDNISASGLFVWTPKSGDIGLHNIAINATDTYGNYASVRKDIKVVPAAVIVVPIPVVSAVAAPIAPPVAGLMAPQAPGYYFAKSLAIGSSGTEVLALQQLLVRLGFLTAIPNGNFGPLTAVAVKKFQASKGLESVGNVGPGTRAKLNAVVGGVGATTTTGANYRFTLPLALGASGNEVLQMEMKLAKLGFLLRVAGSTFDATTAEAVKKFQASKGLEQVGSVGPSTRAALNAN